MSKIELDGCRPIPLGSYLKALGVLRLISSEDNNATGKAADSWARGMWENECFYLETELDRDALLEFFLEDYAPSPIIAPWNGGSGFFGNKGEESIDKLKNQEQKVAKRFKSIAKIITQADTIRDDLNLVKQPVGSNKAEFISRLRAELPDNALGWLDAVLVLSEDKTNFPPLLGSGGNDGNFEFTLNFVSHLISKKTAKHHGLFDIISGEPRSETHSLLESALFDLPSKDYVSTAIGQFSPGEAGGPNAATGFEGDSNINPWDFIFLLEGATSFAGATTRRLQNGLELKSGSRASFPFTVDAVGAGWGGVAITDEEQARAEFWAPLWDRPARFCEIEVLFAEGRAIMNGQTARNGLDFARAAKSLGVSRGFSHFQRFGFLMRSGKAYFATPLARLAVERSMSKSALLISDFDRNSWLERIRRFARTLDAPISARNSVKQFEDALMLFLQQPESRDPAEQIIIELGEICSWLVHSPMGREKLSPPPSMSNRWIEVANDDSPEFRIAAALAGLGLPSTKEKSPEGNNKESLAGNNNGSTDAPNSGSNSIPMAAHFAPIEEEGFLFRRNWLKKDASPTVVWGAGNLVSNMTDILERRIVEMGIRDLGDKPFEGTVPARLNDIIHFLNGDFDDKRCASLLQGLIWIRPYKYLKMKSNLVSIPFAYAALKPLLVSDKTLHQLKVLDETRHLPIPVGLTTRLRAGRGTRNGTVINAEVRSALSRCRASGIHSPFHAWRSGGRNPRQESNQIGVGISPRRLAAALLIPINDWAVNILLKQAYSALQSEDNNTSEGGQNHDT